MALLSGCSGIKGSQVTTETLDQVAVQVHQSNLSDADKSAFDEIKARADNGEYDVTGKTVGQLISDQEAYDADQQAQHDKAVALAAQIKQQHDASVRSLRDALTVALISKGFHNADIMSGDYQDAITFELAFRNNSNKAIRATKGTLDFRNLLGDSIYSAAFEPELSIAPGHSVLFDGSIDFSPYDSSLVALRDASFASIRLDWEPSVILFGDGSKMMVSN